MPRPGYRDRDRTAPNESTPMSPVGPGVRYWLGARRNFPADRAMARPRRPGPSTGPVRAQRAFMGRAVRFLVAEAASASSRHRDRHPVRDVTRWPRSWRRSRGGLRDNDPIVLTHSRALLSSTQAGSWPFSWPTCASRRRSSTTRRSPGRWTSAGRSAWCWWGSCIICATTRTPRGSSGRCWTGWPPAATWR